MCKSQREKSGAGAIYFHSRNFLGSNGLQSSASDTYNSSCEERTTLQTTFRYIVCRTPMVTGLDQKDLDDRQGDGLTANEIFAPIL